MRDQKKIAKISQHDNHEPNDYITRHYLPFDEVTTPHHSQSLYQMPADTFPEEKPLTIALHEIDQKKLQVTAAEEP